MIKVTIERDGCTSRGSFWADCPEFFEEIPDDNFSQIIEKYRTGGIEEGDAPEDIRIKVRRIILILIIFNLLFLCPWPIKVAGSL